MATTAHVSHLAYFAESTPGIGPADASAWASSGTLIRHRNDSLDPSSIKRSMLEDTRSRGMIFDQYPKVMGLENCELTFSLPLSGADAETAATSQVALTKLMTLLQSCLGGLSRGYSTTCTGGTATQPTLTSVTGVDEGVFLAFEDADAPDVLHVRRVTALSGSTATLDEALPFTPAASDPVHAVAVVYVDESSLVDAVAAGRTFSWHCKRGGPAAGGLNYELTGCANELAGIAIGRDSLAWADLRVQAASFDDPSQASDPTWASATVYGLAPAPIGPSAHVWLQDYGTTTANAMRVSEFAVEVGVPVSRVESVTEYTSGMQGTATYSTGPADTTVSMTIVPESSTYWSQLNAGTYKVCRFATRRAPGQNIGIHFSRCEIVEDPGYAAAGDVLGAKVMLRAHPDTANAAAATAALWRTKIAILLF